MNPESLIKILEDFLAEASAAVVLENGEQLFDFACARYSISADHGKCLLHIWSAERNAVRRVLDAAIKKDALVLAVQRFGQSKPSRLEILRAGDRRAPRARKAVRVEYTRLLQRILTHTFPDFSVEKLASTMDLENSFGPGYARGLIKRGLSAFAVFGVNSQELQSSIDGALTFGLLWLELCRNREDSRLVVEGLKLFVPEGTSAIIRERMACLNHAAAKFELFELNEREQTIEQLDCQDRGNIATRLTRFTDQQIERERFRDSIARVLSFCAAYQTEVEITLLSPAELVFRLHGLEFARARTASGDGSQHEIVFGTGAHETVLSEESAELFAQIMQRLLQTRRLDGNRNDPCWRMQPERWLESLVVKDVRALDSSFDPEHVYSQVPAFSASDRAMIDVLTCTGNGRLAVLELKADEDIHLPLQGLDYWTRVQWHHARGEFKQFGYFSGRELSTESPWLMLVAPALRIHPKTDVLLRYLSSEIDCALLGIDERWREGVRVVFRKSHKSFLANAVG